MIQRTCYNNYNNKIKFFFINCKNNKIVIEPGSDHANNAENENRIIKDEIKHYKSKISAKKARKFLAEAVFRRDVRRFKLNPIKYLHVIFK